MIKLGVDVGGTFTDIVVIDEKDGSIKTEKVPSTPKSPDQGVINGIEKVIDLYRIDPHEIDFFIHGTTVATNGLIERKGASVALLVTDGFRDVLHIARQSRPKLYDFFARRPDAFIQRKFRFEVTERILANGEVKTALDESQVKEIAALLRNLDISIAAVCLLHSYLNPDHEQKIREILEKEIPGINVCLSSDILPEIKEYERMSTTVINAYVMPIVESYLNRIKSNIREIGIKSNLHIMQSNGGLMTAETAGQKSVHTVLSGPAAGVLGGVAIANLVGEKNLITIDMGGTSFDVSLVRGGEPLFTMESDIDGHAIKIPMIDIKTLGAGGGSIAWIDAGGALQVGPESAGADPGPACYNRGGTRPTVTDANVVLGYLNPYSLAGGGMDLYPELSRSCIQEKIADPMGISVEEAAEGIIKVVNATMIRGMRLVSVEKGYDPREFCIISFGGAGPVHAVKLAQELNIPKLIIPEAPGVNCALGLLMADFRHDYSKTFLGNIYRTNPDAINKEFKNLEDTGFEQMIEEGVPKDKIEFKRSADLRYAGQGYEIEVEIPAGDYTGKDLAEISAGFSRLHKESYGYVMPDDTVEVVTLRLTALGLMSKPDLREEEIGSENPDHAFKESRTIFLGGEKIQAGIYDRKKLKPGNKIKAPAVIEQADSTTVLFPGYYASVDQYRNLFIQNTTQE